MTKTVIIIIIRVRRLPICRDGVDPQYVQYLSKSHMWQSRVEIEGYPVAYFDRIAAFEAPYR